MSTLALGRVLHPHHQAEALMLHLREGFSENIGRHVVGTYELEAGRPICDTFPDEVISYVDVLRGSMVDGIPSEQIRGAIVDV
jgi:hypothetical protein